MGRALQYVVLGKVVLGWIERCVLYRLFTSSPLPAEDCVNCALRQKMQHKPYGLVFYPGTSLCGGSLPTVLDSPTVLVCCSCRIVALMRCLLTSLLVLSSYILFMVLCLFVIIS